VEVRHASFAVTEEGVSCSTLLVSRYTFRGEPSGPVPDFQLRAGRTGKMRVEGAGHRQSDVKTASSVSLPVAGTRIVLIIGPPLATRSTCRRQSAGYAAISDDPR